MHHIRLKQRTTGAFTIEGADDVTNRCGRHGNWTIQFAVEITSSRDQLDERGFIVDFEVIHAWFRETYEKHLAVFPSCELIACDACEAVVAMLGERALAVEVSVGSGNTPNGMSAKWEAPRSMPIIAEALPALKVS